ncbi:MAG: ABC transporter ATP-binding protein [Burkholderiaceae bacterium]
MPVTTSTTDQLMALSEKNASSAPSTPAVVFDRVCKRYKQQTVLHDVSFSIERGQSIAVVGLNGAGKTTMLRALLGFVGVDSGSIKLFDQDASCAGARQSVAFLPERLILCPDLSGWRSLQTLLLLRGASVSRQVCEHELAQLGFPIDKLDAPARTYSKGMSQKIGLAAAICSNARLIILDEPLSGLDPMARRAMHVEMMRCRARETGLLFTAHSLDGLETLCDQVLVIHQGQLKFFGPPAGLQAASPITPSSKNTSRSLEQAFLDLVAMPLETAS